VAAGQVDDRLPGPASQRAGPPYGGRVEVEDGANA
jgi:hypothetical protein